MLPSSVKSGDVVTFEMDGISSHAGPIVVERRTASPVSCQNSSYIVEQTDGSWLVVAYETAADVGRECASGNYTVGSHTVEFLDASGHVLEKGGYTVAP